MIKNTHAAHPHGTLVAYSDNAAVMEGAQVERFYPADDSPLPLLRQSPPISS